MEDINNLGEVFYKGDLINLKKMPVIDLEKKLDTYSSDGKRIKNSIIKILEEF